MDIYIYIYTYIHILGVIMLMVSRADADAAAGLKASPYTGLQYIKHDHNTNAYCNYC